MPGLSTPFSGAQPGRSGWLVPQWGCVGGPDLSLGEHRWDSRWPHGVLLMVAARRAAAVADDCPASPPSHGRRTESDREWRKQGDCSW